jgi:hypothetical protein
MAIVEIARIQVRRGQELQNGVPQLEPGEFGWAQDTENLYIGKRISEGASSNENTRILTENDIENIFSILNVTSTATIISPYKYRSETPHIASASVPRFIQNKLDEEVSICEFGVIQSFTATDISTEFQTGVNTIFYNSTWNSFQRKDARRKLKIPAGHYLISNAIELPPYTFLEGEGEELTKLTLVSTTTNIFRTIDADGNTFETGSMESGVKRSRQITIKGITLEYDPNYASNNALISIDNVLDASIEDCILRTAFNSTSTTTYGLVNAGIGISIRGTGGGLGSGDVNLCENVTIQNCKLDGLYIGVRTTGTVIRPTIEQNVFSNLNRGVEFYTIDSLPGPSNGIIKNNRFENIVREGIFVGENPDNLYRSNHLSENNFFIQTGNGAGLTDNITSSTNTNPIIRFNSQGNKSINDYFNRRALANKSSSTFYYAPLVNGIAVISSVEITSATVSSSATTSITKIPLTGGNQFVSVIYQMFNGSLSRSGEISLNIANDGYPSLTDTYNYVETIEEGAESPEIYFEVSDTYKNSKNYLDLMCVNNSTQLTVEYSINTLI